MKTKLTNIMYFSILTSLIYSPSGHTQPGPIASINGEVCSFNRIVDAIAAANPNDVVNIREGYYTELLGEISKDIRLVASRGLTGSGCEFGDNAVTVTIDGQGQSFEANGGLVKITNDARVTFINVNLTNASAINGGIMAIFDGSSVLMNNSDIYNGSALTSGGNVYLSSDNPESQSQLILTNGSAIYAGTVVTGNGGGVALYDSTLTITEGSIGLMGVNQGNLASNNGGGIYAENSTITVNSFDSNIQNNQAENFGGGIYLSDSTMTITNATVNNNTTDLSGGGIYSDSSDISLIDATISSNVTTRASGISGGAGLFLTGSGEVVIDATTIVSNLAEASGGGVLNNGDSLMLSIINGSDIINNSSEIGGGIRAFSDLLIDNSTIRFNTSGFTGGGINCTNCQNLIVNSSQITNNTSGTGGGGIRITSNNQTNVELRNSTFTGNSAVFIGGAIGQEGGTLLTESSIFSSNTAGNQGGAISLFFLDQVQNNARILNSDFINNSTSSSDQGDGGGALYLDEIESAQITASNFNNNNSDRDGGAIYIFDSTLKIDESFITENNALKYEGGGIYSKESDLTINNSFITLNQSFIQQNLFPGNFGGGGIKALNSNLELINTKVNQNTNNDMGGGIFFDGGADNTFSVSSSYGNLPEQCFPSTLGSNEYCSEISFNTALFGAAIMIKSTAPENSFNLSGLALNENISNSFGFLPNDSGAVIQFDIGDFHNTDIKMENLIMVESEGFIDDLPLIQINGIATIELLSATIAANTGKPLQVTNENATVIVQNSILQQNTAGSLVGNGISFISLCNNSESADVSGQSFGANLGSPQFVSTSRGDYRLAPTSPSVDMCSFGASHDIDGNTRPNDNSNYDQGAFEMGATIFLDLIFENGFE